MQNLGYTYILKSLFRTSLADQQLRLHASNAGGEGSISGQGTKNPTCRVVMRWREGKWLFI